MNFLKTTISRSFISLTLLSTAFISCETEDSGEVDLIEGAQATVLTEEEFLQSMVFEDANIDEENVVTDVLTSDGADSDGLSTISDNELESRLDGNNSYFYVDNGNMKNWESFRVYYTTHSNGASKSANFTVTSSTNKKWIGAKVWGANNNRATVRVVPYSGNNKTHYWGKAKTYYLWFNSTGGNTLNVTVNNSDPNGK